jgi:PadR family transcriptional regulator AphA
LQRPVCHLRDVRSELLLKVMLARRCGIDITVMLDAQQERIDDLAAAIAAQAEARSPADVVDLWRAESSRAASRFLQRLRQQG